MVGKSMWRKQRLLVYI